jgi:hypothetical protein
MLFTAIGGIASIVMFVWIAVPMYIGIGHLLKSFEFEEKEQDRITDANILDDLLETD